MSRLDWHGRLMGLARHVAGWSKDPSTQVGAVIADRANRIVSLGYNGFPRGVRDRRLKDREYKLARIVHAEMNALLFARGSVEGARLYVWPMPPCSLCAGPIIQAGIAEIYAPPPGERWRESCDHAREMFEEAGVRVRYFSVAETPAAPIEIWHEIKLETTP